MKYRLKKGTWDVFPGMPRLETVFLKDLQVGDIIFDREGDVYESFTVTDVSKCTPAQLEKEEIAPYQRKHPLFYLTVVSEDGALDRRGPYRKDGGFSRQTSEAAWRKRRKEEMIIAHRSSVRTLLGSAESSMGERPKQQFLQVYWDELNEIVERLTVLERRMTVDAGRDPEKDKRKMTNHRGRARR